jgi:hypothetical protein
LKNIGWLTWTFDVTLMTSKTLSESEKESFYAKIKEEGLTQSAFCKRYGLNQGNFSNCLRNDYGSPKSVEAVRKYLSSDAYSPLLDSELPPSPYKSPKVKKSTKPSSTTESLPSIQEEDNTASSKPVKSRAKKVPSKKPTPPKLPQEEEEDALTSNKPNKAKVKKVLKLPQVEEDGSSEEEEELENTKRNRFM